MSDTNLKWLRTTPIAHRGLWGPGIPENSLAAFNEAINRAYAIELDVRMTRDGQLIICHDASTGRVATQDKFIREHSASEIQGLKLTGSDQKIPTLQETLKTINGLVPVLIEIKTGSPVGKICQKVTGCLDSYGGRIAICSFDPRVVAWLRKHRPDIARGQSGGSLYDRQVPSPLRAFARLMPLNWWSKPDFIVYDIRDFERKGGYRSHLPVLLWPVKTPTQFDTARKARMNVIFERTCGLA
jgi:glycerophosphoryl diester phosphodiesterase